VNTNVLLYLGNSYPRVCDYVNNAIENDTNCSIYYPDRLSLFYSVSRAFVNNISCFGKNKEIVIEKVLSRRKKNGSFGNPLQTALATNTLLNYGYDGPELKDGISYLIENQEDDGSWSREIFFLGPAPYYGFEELTTALVVEALNNYMLFILR
jgi:hypothetical protein